MTDRPVIFSAPMVLALLAGRKTMTRRLAWGKPVGIDVDEEANAEVRAEGIPQAAIDKWGKWLHPNDCPGKAFGEIWDALHGDGAWDENPEVVALSFTVHKQNIDALAEAA